MKNILLLILIIFITLPAHAQEPNYCHDKESWKEWDELVAKYPHDMDIQMLHAVRIGLCKKVEDGSISFETARDVFNDLHETVFERAKQERKRAGIGETGFMKNAVLIIALLLSFSCPAYPDDNKFCNDPPHWEHFNSMVANDPDNIPLQILHALKIGLCVKIEQNSISTQEAVGLFTDMLNTLIDKADEAEKQEGKENF